MAIQTLRVAAGHRIARVSPPLVVALGFALIWEVAARTKGSILIPTFLETSAAFASLLSQSEVWAAFLTSNESMVVGYLLAVLIGLPSGFLMGRVALLSRTFSGYFVLLLAVPVAPLIPIIIIALGTGLEARALVVVLFALPFIVLNSRTGVRTVDKTLIEMARSYGAREWVLWRRVLLPGALPAVMAGLRIGMARAVAGMVVVELLLVPTGIGGLLNAHRARFDMGLMYATVLMVILEAVLLIFGMRLLQRKLLPWAPS